MTRRRKLLSELAVSVMSGALLAGAAKAGTAVTHARWLTSSVPLWALVLTTAIGASLTIFSLVDRDPGQRRVLLVVPAFIQKHWLAGLLKNIVHVLEIQGYDTIVKMPFYDYSGQGQLFQLESAVKRRREYAGAFIVAAEPELISSGLKSFCGDTGFPVIFIDVRPFTSTADYPPGSAFVGADQPGIGAVAAKWSVDYLGQQQKRASPSVLVVCAFSQADRQRRFISVVQGEIPGVKIELNDKGGFSRENAREIVARHIKTLRTRSQNLDLIFCTNDEMALGALDAVYEAEASGIKVSDVAIIGVDGTNEAKAIIQSGGTPFRATVVQESRVMAEIAVGMLTRALKGESIEKETVLQPYIYPPA